MYSQMLKYLQIIVQKSLRYSLLLEYLEIKLIPNEDQPDQNVVN